MLDLQAASGNAATAAAAQTSPGPAARTAASAGQAQQQRLAAAAAPAPPQRPPEPPPATLVPTGQPPQPDSGSMRLTEPMSFAASEGVAANASASPEPPPPDTAAVPPPAQPPAPPAESAGAARMATGNSMSVDASAGNASEAPTAPPPAAALQAAMLATGNAMSVGAPAENSTQAPTPAEAPTSASSRSAVAASGDTPRLVGVQYACTNAPGVHFYLSPQLYALLRSNDTTCRDGGGGGIIICANMPITAAAYTAATGDACELQVCSCPARLQLLSCEAG